MPERVKRTWRDLAVLVPPQTLARNITDFDLPGQLLDFARRHQLSTVGETLAHPDLHGGHRTFNVALKALKAPRRPSTDLTRAPSLARALRARLKVLTKEQRDIICARAGLDGRVETLEALGSRIGGSREGIRRQEEAAVRVMGRDGFRAAVSQRLLQPMRRGGIALDAPGARWLMDHGGPDVVRFAMAHFVDPGEQPHVVEVSGALYLLPLSGLAFDALWRQARVRLAELTYPAKKRAVTMALTLGAQPPGIADALLHRAAEALVWNAARRVALTYGTGREEQVLAALRASPTPLTMWHITRSVGTRALPEEAMYFGPGVVGLKQHFPNFDEHYEVLIPAIVNRMQSDPERQWVSRELILYLRSTNLPIPEWMNHWHLSCLMQRSDALRYLGRNYFTLAASPTLERLQYKTVLAALLSKSQAPMSIEAILEAVTRRRGISRAAVLAVLEHGPFVQTASGWSLRR